MHLQNGKFYTTKEGHVVIAQMESDGKFHCYDVKGSEMTTVEADGHVEGWMPVGRAVFKAARAALKVKKAKDKPDDSKKK